MNDHISVKNALIHSFKRHLSVICFVSVFAALVIIAAVIPSVRHYISGVWNNPERMAAFPEDPQIHYENGASDYAGYVAGILPDCIAQVEAMQGRPFAHPVTIGVYITKEAYAAANGTGNSNAAGTSFMGHILLSPDLYNDQRQRMSAILTHELSHAHLQGWIPTLKYFNIPNWFKEGLAVMVSGGGGAERISEDDALSAIRKGEHISMETKGSLFHLSGIAFEHAADESVPPQMPYKQADMFVAYLRDRNDEGFKTMLSELLNGQSFENALFAGYDTNLGALWSDYEAAVNSSQ